MNDTKPLHIAPISQDLPGRDQTDGALRNTSLPDGALRNTSLPDGALRAPVPQVLLGNTGLSVSRAGFGVLPMGPAQLALPLEEGARLISYAMDCGINFFDTANC